MGYLLNHNCYSGRDIQNFDANIPNSVETMKDAQQRSPFHLTNAELFHFARVGQGVPLSWSTLPQEGSWDQSLGAPWKGPGVNHWGTSPEGTCDQSLGYTPERTWNDWLEVLSDGDGVNLLPPPPPVDRQTDACENFTSAHPSDALGKYERVFSCL